MGNRAIPIYLSRDLRGMWHCLPGRATGSEREIYSARRELLGVHREGGKRVTDCSTLPIDPKGRMCVCVDSTGLEVAGKVRS